jgi:L-threonate 2-dehydrogenase
MTKIVGIIGLGIMGSAMALNLVERGWRVIGFDTDAGKRADMAAAGVVIAASAADVALKVAHIITSLPTPKALDAVAAPASSWKPAR